MEDFGNEFSVTDIQFAEHMASLVSPECRNIELQNSGEGANDRFKEMIYCQCNHQNSCLYDEIEDDNHFYLLCLICDKPLDMGQPKHSDQHTTDGATANQPTTNQSSICPCGNSIGYDTIEKAEKLTLVCQTCEKKIEIPNEDFEGEKEPVGIVHDCTEGLCSCGSSEDFHTIEDGNTLTLVCNRCGEINTFPSDSPVIHEEKPKLCRSCSTDSSKDDNVKTKYLCSFCGSFQNFQVIEEDTGDITLVCQTCENLIHIPKSPDQDKQPPARSSGDITLVEDKVDELSLVKDSAKSNSLVFYADAKVVTCCICNELWKINDDGSLPPAAETHVHVNDIAAGVSNTNIGGIAQLCTKAPRWELVQNVSDIKRSDHISFWSGCYYKNAIVADFELPNKIWIIRYRFRPTSKIVEEEIDAKMYSFYRAVYPGRTHDADVVLARARSRLGEERYNILTNYARAFPRWCKTGYGGICSVVPSDLGSYHVSESRAVAEQNVSDIRGLQIGDHIKWWRKGLYWHHAIVTGFLNKENQQFVDVIHYTLMDVPNTIAGFIAKVVEKWQWVEVSAERMMWHEEAKKLVSYTATLGVQCLLNNTASQRKRKKCLHFLEAILQDDGKRSVSLQVDFTEFAQNGSLENLGPDMLEYVDDPARYTNTGADRDSKNSEESYPDNGMLFKVIYSGTTYAVDVILEKAKSKIGEANYLLLKNNCEHFATWCCTGKFQSKQVEELYEKGVSLSGQVVKEAFRMLEVLLPRIPGNLPNLLTAVKSALSKVVNVIPIEAVAFVVFLAMETITKSMQIYQCCMSCKRGEIEEADRNTAILKEISQFVADISGCSIGMMLGSLLPTPLLVTTISMIAGLILGHVAGGILGYKMASVCAQKATNELKKAKK